MDHWFDDFTRGLTSSKLSRRSALSMLAMTVGGIASFRNRLAKPAQMRRALKPAAHSIKVGPCIITRNGLDRTTQYSSTTESGGKEVTINETWFSGPGLRTFHISVAVAGTVQLQVNISKTNFSMTLGPGFGLGTATFVSRDRKVLTGRVDGREIIPVHMRESPKELRFADEQPAPRMREETGIREAMVAAFAAASRDAKLCISTKGAKFSNSSRRSN